MLKRSEGTSTTTVIVDILVGVNPGLNSVVARELHDRVRALDCELTLESERGVANGRRLFELLMLGAKTGDRLKLRAIGPAAHAAIEATKLLLVRRGPDESVEREP